MINNKVPENSVNSVNEDKLLEIRILIDEIKNINTLQKTAKKLVVYDGNLDSKVMFIGEAQVVMKMNRGYHLWEQDNF